MLGLKIFARVRKLIAERIQLHEFSGAVEASAFPEYWGPRGFVRFLNDRRELAKGYATGIVFQKILARRGSADAG